MTFSAAAAAAVAAAAVVEASVVTAASAVDRWLTDPLITPCHTALALFEGLIHIRTHSLMDLPTNDLLAPETAVTDWSISQVIGTPTAVTNLGDNNLHYTAIFSNYANNTCTYHTIYM